MARQIETETIEIFTHTAPCAHSCRYCLIGRKHYEKIPFARFSAIVKRFVSWRQSRGFEHIKLIAGAQPSFNFDTQTLKEIFELNRLLGWGDLAGVIKLGGLRLRRAEEVPVWLKELKEEASLNGVHASVAGFGSLHDYWNRRKGDFEFLFNIMKEAAELGLRVHQRLFVTRSTLPTMSELIEKLDTLPVEPLRYLSIFIYRGFAGDLENERITEEVRDNLPECLSDIQHRDGDEWLSEREWIDRIMSAPHGPERVQLRLEITDENIDRLEAMSCDDIVCELEERIRQAYAQLPDSGELCERNGDSEGLRIYSARADIERMWFDRHLRKSRLPIYRDLTHLALED